MRVLIAIVVLAWAAFTILYPQETRISLFGLAYGAPPENADPALAPWFKSLKQPDSGVSCCDVADCRPVDARGPDEDGNYDALVSMETHPGGGAPHWISVPKAKVLPPMSNPVGRAVLCWRPSLGVMCFIRGTET